MNISPASVTYMACCLGIALFTGRVSAQAISFAPLPPVQPLPASALPANSDRFGPPVATATVAATAPVIAEFTRSAKPADAIVLSGIRFSAYPAGDVRQGSDTRFVVWARADDGTTVQADADILSLRGDLATISLPPTLPPWRTYVLWPVNASGAGTPVLLNRTDFWWIGPGTATQGDVVGLHGRNLSHANGTTQSSIWIQRPDGTQGRWLTPSSVNPYRLEFVVPADLADGEWRVWIHNGHGGAWGWSGPQTFFVNQVGQWHGVELNLASFGAVPDDGVQDSDAFDAAIAALKASPPGSTLRIPAGTYDLIRALPNIDGLRLAGAGIDATHLRMMPGYGEGRQYEHTPLPSGSNYEIADLSLDFGNSIRDSHSLRFSRVRFSDQPASTGDTHTLDTHDSQGLLFIDCIFVTNGGWFAGITDDITFRGCTFLGFENANQLFVLWGGGRLAMVNCQGRDLDNTRPDGWAQGRFYVGQSIWKSIDGVYIGGCTTTDLGVQPGYWNQNTGEQILNEGGSNKWRGATVGTGADYIVMPGSDDHADLVGEVLAIVEGTGRGQSRHITRWDAPSRRLYVDAAFLLPPDAQSIVNIGRFYSRNVVYDCLLDGKAAALADNVYTASCGVSLYGCALDTIIAKNTFHELRSGGALFTAIQNAIDGTNFCSPFFFTLTEDNTYQNCRVGFFIYGVANAYNSTLNLTEPITWDEALTGNVFRNSSMTGITQNPYLVSSETGAYGTDGAAMTVIDGLTALNSAPIALNGPKIGEQIFRDVVLGASTASAAQAAIQVSDPGKLSAQEITATGFAQTFGGSGLPGPVLSVPRRVVGLTPITGGWTSEVTLINAGTAPLVWTAYTDASWLNPVTTGGTLAVGGQIILTLSASVLPAQTTQATLTLSSNGGVQQITVLAPTAAAPVLPAAPTLAANSTAAPTLSGFAPVGTTVRVKIDGGEARLTTPDATGAWSLTLTDVASGPHLASVQFVNGDGTAGAWSPAVAFTRSGPPLAPAAPVILADHTADTACGGSGPAYATVLVNVDGQAFGQTTVDAAGNWTLSLAGTEPGAHQVAAAFRIGQTTGAYSATAAFMTPAAPGEGSGLTGVYYVDATFSTVAATEVDALVAFNWNSTSPPAPVTLPTLSVIWTGGLEAPITGLYSFRITTGGPAELWIDDQKIVTGFTNQYTATLEGSTNLVAGRRHKIRITYADTGGDERMVVSWSGPAGVAANLLPTAQLYPAGPVVGLLPPATPAAPVITGQDSGAPVAAGTATPGTTVTVYVDGVPGDPMSVGPGGTWSYTLPSSLGIGAHVVRVASRNQSGASALSAPAVARVDGPGYSLPYFWDDNVFPDPIIYGYASPSALITVYCQYYNLQGYARADSSGLWRFAARQLLNQVYGGFNTIETNVLGTGILSDSRSGLSGQPFNGTRPAALAVPAVINDNSSLVSLVGAAPAASRVMVVVDNEQRALVTVGDDGRWTWSDTTLAPGPHTLTLISIVTPAVGVTTSSADSAPFTLTVGTNPPVPTVPAAPSAPSVITDGDGLPVVTGTAAPFSLVELKIGSKVVGRAWADAAGNWTATVQYPYGGGPYALVATASNGNGSSPSGPSASLTIATPAAMSGYGQWLGQYGLPITETGQGAPTADPDGDGVNNLLEYALGSDPTSASAPALTINVANQKLNATFRRARAELTYAVEGSSDLKTWTTLATNPGTVGQDVTVPDSPPNGATKRFLRLRVTAP